MTTALITEWKQILDQKLDRNAPLVNMGMQAQSLKDMQQGRSAVINSLPLVLLQELLEIKVGEGSGCVGPGVLKPAAVCVAASQGMCTCTSET